ncbi:hypothetical protein MUP77_02465 [Candidatus Bathyarchaeota archaeon]|nr:hypothetical protein [Candidatus Bathyarchaeota archaeon]
MRKIVIGLSLAVLAVLSAFALFTPSGYAYTKYVRTPLGKYFVLETCGINVVAWLRNNPYQCSTSDIRLGTLKGAISSVDLAMSCGACIAWYAGATVCVKLTIPTVALPIACVSTYPLAQFYCSQCVAGFLVNVIFRD